MEALIPALLPAATRRLIGARLPKELEPVWWETPDELERLAARAQVGWFDLFDKAPALRALASARDLRWLNTGFAGVDWLPLDELQERGITLTNGSGLTAITVAEFTIMGMIAIARQYPAIVRAQDQGIWIDGDGGDRELAGSRALLLGYGAIGRRIAALLRALAVDVVPVRSKPDAEALGPGQWQSLISEFDWIVLSLPATQETMGLIGAREFAAMKGSAILVNVGRAETIDQGHLIQALDERRIAAALLDLTNPEPLPPNHRLWRLDNAHVTMHRAGRPTPASRQRAADRFVANCKRYVTGEPLEAQVDLRRGY